MRSKKYLIPSTALAAISLVTLVGCRSEKSLADKHTLDHSHTNGHADDGESNHENVPGAHGGSIVPVGQGNYHVEALLESGGTLRLYMLGNDETRVKDVETQALTAHAKPANGEAVQFTLSADPQQGDAEGNTSSFVGEIPLSLRNKQFEVTIPNLRIESERFRVSFSFEAPHDANHDADVPVKVTDDEEYSLYLTPGGLYSAADIAANGHRTASQKFAGFDSDHNLKPAPGDLICPVTLTKANELCTWIVGGKEYQFCCPPCVDEFVAKAKEEPSSIKAPDEYVKQ